MQERRDVYQKFGNFYAAAQEFPNNHTELILTTILLHIVQGARYFLFGTGNIRDIPKK